MSLNLLTPILVVEDDLADGFFLTEQLRMAHLDDCVTLVRSGEEALEFLSSTPSPPRVLFLDLQLPGNRHPHQRVYALTCLETNLVISNMETFFNPPKTAFSASSALICVLIFLSCRLFFLM